MIGVLHVDAHPLAFTPPVAACSYWHTFRGVGLDPFGGATIFRPWEDGTNSVENATRRADVAFEFFQKLGVDYYTFHDVDVSPQGASLKESNANFDKVRCRVAPTACFISIKIAALVRHMLWCAHHSSLCALPYRTVTSPLQLAAHLAKKQKETGVKLLWGTANLFSHHRFHSGAATNPQAEIFAYGASQVRSKETFLVLPERWYHRPHHPLQRENLA